MKLPVFYFSLILNFVSISTSASATQVIGNITKLRGQVSILEVGSRDAKPVELGQSVSKEASLLTSDKSFVQILMLDKSQVNLGPNSKITLDLVKGEKIGVISLLKGMIRAEVIKNDGSNTKGKNKLYIKSRTAALGIRGTDFQTSYNPDSQITNLITFRGEVAMVKTVNKNSTEIEAALDSKNAVIVESGKFATVTEVLNKVTEPIKISPTQYTSLKLNSDMLEKSTFSNEVFQAEFKKTIDIYNEHSKKEISNKNLGGKIFNSDAQVFRPTAGGVIDLNSGIYVAPSTEQSNYVKELNIYEFKSDKGTLSDTGNYLPPEGIKLDAKLGFVSETQSDSKSAELKLLNSEISGQVKLPPKLKKEELRNDTKDSDDSYDKYFTK